MPARTGSKPSCACRAASPANDTFSRLFQALDPAAFAETFAQWTQGLRQRLEREVIALDGKAARRATVAGQSPRHLVSAWATESGLTLRQLELAGCIITADALHCQKTIAREITEAEADYVLALKGNQAPCMRKCGRIRPTRSPGRIRNWPR